MNDIKQMNLVILHFSIKYNGNWEKIYNAIKTRESVEIEQINSISKLSEDFNFTTIVDEKYPNNFKSIYMPPLVIFCKGNKELIYNDNSIIAIYNAPSFDKFKELNLSKQKIYSFIYNEKYIDEYNKLLTDGYKLIIVSNNFDAKAFSSINEGSNLLLISEIPSTIQKPDIDVEQTIERILLGVSKDILWIDKISSKLNCLLPLFKFEKRSVKVIDIKNYSEAEIKRYCIEQYDQLKN